MDVHNDFLLNTKFTDRVGYSGGITWLKGYDSTYEYRLQMENSTKLMLLRRTAGSSDSFSTIINLGLLASFLQIKNYTATYSINGNAELGLKGTDFSTSTPSDYVPIAIVSYSTGHGSVHTASISATATGSSTVMTVRNISGSNLSNMTARISVLYARTDFITT